MLQENLYYQPMTQNGWTPSNAGGNSNICQTCKSPFPDTEILKNHYRLTGHHFHYEFYKKPLKQRNQGASRQQYDHPVMKPSVAPPVITSSHNIRYPMLNFAKMYGLDVLHPNLFEPQTSPLQQNTSQPPTTSYSQREQFHPQVQSSAPNNLKRRFNEISTQRVTKTVEPHSTQIKRKEQRPTSLCASGNREVSSMKQNVLAEVNKTQGYIEKIQKSIPTSEVSVEGEVQKYNFCQETDRVLKKLMKGGNIQIKYTPKQTNENNNQSESGTTTDSHTSTYSGIKKRRVNWLPFKVIV